MPKTFEVYVKEKATRKAWVEVEAKNWEEAESKVRDLYYSNAIEFEYDTEDLEIEVEDEVNL